MLEGARPEGAEHVYRWRAEILDRRRPDRRGARRRDARAIAEVEAKAAQAPRPRAAQALPRLAPARRVIGPARVLALRNLPTMGVPFW